MRRSGTGPAAVWILVLGLPLAASPTASDPVLPLRMLVLGVGLALGLLATPDGRLPRSLLVATGAALAVFAAAALAGATPLLSLLGRYPRYEGLPMLLAYLAAAVVGAGLLGRDGLRRHALNALAAACVANAAVAAAQWTLDPSTRVTGTLGNSTTLATFALIGIAMLGATVTRTDRWRWAGLAAAAACLALSASRGALAAGVLAALTLVLVRRGARRPGRWWWGPACAAVLLVGAWLAPGTRARLSGTTPFAEATIGGRLLLWQEAVRLIGAHPWLGVGPSRFVDSIGAFHTPAWAAQVGPYAPPDSPHDVVLQVLTSTGVAGLAAAIGVGATLAVALWRTRPWDGWQVGTALAAVGVLGSYATSFTDPVTMVVLALLVGGAVAVPRSTTTPVRPAAARAVAAVAALCLGLALGGSALVAEARYSAAAAATGDATSDLLAVAPVRPWDADLARRVGYTAARLAESGRARPAAFVPGTQEACVLLPGSVECLQALADLQDLAGDHAAALSSLERAGELDAVNVDTLLRQGIALSELGRNPEAVARFQAAARLRPTAPEPWDDLAQVYATTGDENAAASARARADELRHR